MIFDEKGDHFGQNNINNWLRNGMLTDLQVDLNS